MISVLMPTYNCSEYISDAIKSILNQTYKGFEFLIIDDGSTDSTKEIVSIFNDSRIKYIQKEHTGFSDSLNYGLRIAKSDLIVRMDADDIANQNLIVSHLHFRQSNPRIDILGCHYAVFTQNIEYLIKNPLDNNLIINGLTLYSLIPHSGCSYNKKVILENGGYVGAAFEDYELWLRIKDKAKFSNINRVLLFVRYRKDSLSRMHLRQKQSIIYKIQEPYYRSFRFSFPDISPSSEAMLRGWREYFYGDKKLARKYWLKNPWSLFKDYRQLPALLLTFLSRNTLNAFIENRFRYRLNYLISFFSKDNRYLRNEFKKFVP